MKNRLYSLCGKIVRPITENPVFFGSVFTIIYLPSLFYWIINYSSWLRLYSILAFPVVFALAYILALAVHLSGGCKRYVKRTCYLLFGIPSLVEILLIVKFHTRFSALMFRLVAETNMAEVKGFFSTYVLQQDVLFWIVALAVLVFLIVYAEHKFAHAHLKLSNPIVCLLAAFVLSSSALYAYRDVNFLPKFFAKDIDSLKRIRPVRFGTPYVSLGLLLQSAKIHSLSLNDVAELEKVLSRDVTATSSLSKGTIVLVIGESYIKHHSSLYGYSLETNPRLKDEYKAKNLFLFQDVLAPHNSTSKCMQKMLSLYNQDSKNYWTSYPIFPSIFKKAGFKSLLISNQEAFYEANEWDCANYYLVSPQTSPYLFDWCTREIEQWDMDLVRENADSVDQHTSDRNLIIYHLMGQHVGYKQRCPDDERVFTVSDYEHRKDITNVQKEYVAHYDNATLYNDKVVAAILDQFRDQEAIVVYLSDHGEEVYDYRDHMGRSHEPIITPERAKYQFEVPFMIWMSDKYKENHPEVVAQVERSVDRPYMIDDLPHLMLDLAGIECEWFDPTRSVINDRFNAKRKRLLLDSKQDYDVIMKGAKHNGGL